jgi:hypothetical protein
LRKRNAGTGLHALRMSRGFRRGRYSSRCTQSRWQRNANKAIRSIRSASTSQACRRAGRLPPSWQRRMRSVRGRRDPFRPRLRRGKRTSLRCSSPCGRGRFKIGYGGPPVPTIVFHGDRDTKVHPNNGERIVERSADAASQRARLWTGAPRARVYPHDRLRRGRARHLRALEYSRCRPRLVGRQSHRLLHRSARPGRQEGNAAFLPRSFAPGLIELHRPLFGSAVMSETSRWSRVCTQ